MRAWFLLSREMQLAALIAFLGLLLHPPKTYACGITWSTPKSHFDGVDYQGFVFLVERLGSIDVGDVKIPLYATFNPSRSWSSPYGNLSWDIPLLCTRIVQVNDDSFRLDQPDGWFRVFWRDKKSPNTLHGQGGWKAEIFGDVITAYAPCGTKFVFKRGKIVSMQLEDRHLTYLYDGNRVVEIRDGNNPVLRVEVDPSTSEVTGLDLGVNGRIKLDSSERPIVQQINGKNLVQAVAKSLSKITFANGQTKTYEYGLDNVLHPTLKVGTRLITWDASGHILKDGDWTYHVSPGKGPFSNAVIRRENSNKEIESWHYDKEKGYREVLAKDGTIIKYWYFVSGKNLAGKLRRREVSKNGKIFREERYSFDELGRYISEKRLSNGVTLETLFEYRDGKCYARELNAGKVLSMRVYDNSRKLIEQYIAEGFSNRIRNTVTGEIYNSWEELNKIGKLKQKEQ